MRGLLQRAIAERRASSSVIGNPQDPSYWVQKLFGGGAPVTSGVDVTPTTALSWTAISAGVRISAETIGSLPWGVYERLERGRKERWNHPLWFLLHSEPNDEMTSMEFFETCQSHALWFSGSASQIVRDNAGIIRELWPLNPDRCRWQRDEHQMLWLHVTVPGVSGTRVLPASDVLWVRGFSTDGLWGASLPGWHKEAIGLGLATEMFVGAFFGRGAHAGGVLSHPKTLSKEAQARLRESVEKQVGGLDRAHRMLLLEEGMTWTQTTIDPQKAELLGLRNFQVAEAARILRLPPHMLGDMGRATWSNVEQMSAEFVRDHVRPWTIRWEQRCNKQLFGRKEAGRLYVKANLDALQRGDMKTRFDSYRTAIASRFMTPNEARDLEDLNPGPAELDEFQVSPNLNAPSAPATPDDGGTDGQDPGAAPEPAAA